MISSNRRRRTGNNLQHSAFLGPPQNQTNKVKSVFFKIPEYALIAMLLAAGYTPPFQLNPIFLCLAAVVVLQIVLKNRFSGLIIGTLFFLGNLFFLGALVSEFSEFEEMNQSASNLMWVGLPVWLLNSVLSLTMIYKYGVRSPKDPLTA